MKTIKRKIFNDPVYGFVTVPDALTFSLIEHPYFQRLRRIKQLGQTHLVYPGALHTRFHHALGAMHLMQQAVEVIRSKGHEITSAEASAVTSAILLHDIGHGPFSHALENTLVHNMDHEDISELFMDRLNREFGGALSLAIKIFRNEYRKKFLHQLVSSQLDVDRLDYLNRDSFYSGVTEGTIGSDRIVKMLNVHRDELVVDVKGIYSIENFILARRLMYWQVYLHKTVLSAENMLVKILQRAKELASQGNELFCTPALGTFLYNRYGKKAFLQKPELLEEFSMLDDNDIMASVKVWTRHPDNVLSRLCRNLVHRRLYRVELKSSPFSTTQVSSYLEKVSRKYRITKKEAAYFAFTGSVQNETYRPDTIRINILYPGNRVKDITKASDQFNTSALAKTVTKYFLCCPKDIV